jgi:DNA-binding MarR family transcriptional regulator
LSIDGRISRGSSSNDAGEGAGPQARLGFLLYRAGLAVARGYERALAPVGASPAEAGVLSTLSYDGPNHIRGLARLLGLGRQTIVNVTRRLEADGRVVRQADATDARLALFAITSAGRDRLATIEAIAMAFDAQLRATVGADSEAMLVDRLQFILADPSLSHDD